LTATVSLAGVPSSDNDIAGCKRAALVRLHGTSLVRGLINPTVPTTPALFHSLVRSAADW